MDLNGWSPANKRTYAHSFTDGSLDPASQFELDAAWNAAMANNPTKVDLLCARVCAEIEPELSDIPTWEQLAPLYN